MGTTSLRSSSILLPSRPSARSALATQSRKRELFIRKVIETKLKLEPFRKEEINHQLIIRDELSRITERTVLQLYTKIDSVRSRLRLGSFLSSIIRFFMLKFCYQKSYRRPLKAY